MCELGDEELSLKTPTIREERRKDFRDVGWFTDGRGYKHYGVIPKTEEERNGWNRVRKQDSWLDKELI